jgi:hypothetical protein
MFWAERMEPQSWGAGMEGSPVIGGEEIPGRLTVFLSLSASAQTGRWIPTMRSDDRPPCRRLMHHWEIAAGDSSWRTTAISLIERTSLGGRHPEPFGCSLVLIAAM